jgi:hypothetical protein
MKLSNCAHKLLKSIVIISCIVVNNCYANTQVCDGDLARIQADRDHDGLAFVERVGRSGTAWCNYSDDGILDKPIIIAEGFDFAAIVSQVADDNTDGEEVWSLLNVRGDAEVLRGLGYDFVIIDYDDPLAPIQANSLLFSKLISEINFLKKGIYKNIIAGFSMGGLIAKTALSYMEYEDLDHQASLYISLDSPHGCAQINRDLQMIVQYGAAQNDDEQIKRLWEDVLRSDAALQMMCSVAHDYDNGIGLDFVGYGRDKKLRGAYNFNRLRYSKSGNGFPLLTRNVSFTNGGGLTQIASPGDLLVDLNQERNNLDIYADGERVPNDTMPGSTAPWFDMLTNMLPNAPTVHHWQTTYISTLSAIGLGPVQSISFGIEGRSDKYWEIYERALYAQPREPGEAEEAMKDLSSEDAWDYMRGSNLYFFHVLDPEKPKAYLAEAVEAGLFPQKEECTILNNEGVEEERCYTFPEYNTNLLNVSELEALTPFDAIYINTENAAHNSLPAAHSENLLNEIIANTRTRYEIILPAISLIIL